MILNLGQQLFCSLSYLESIRVFEQYGNVIVVT